MRTTGSHSVFARDNSAEINVDEVCVILVVPAAARLEYNPYSVHLWTRLTRN